MSFESLSIISSITSLLTFVMGKDPRVYIERSFGGTVSGNVRRLSFYFVTGRIYVHY